MHTVHVDFSIHYVKSNLSKLEKHPQLRCFLDARFDRTPLTIQLKKEGGIYNGRVSGNIVNAKSIPPTTAICFASFAWRENEFKSPCLLDTGVSHVTFGEIANGILSSGAFEKEMHMIMYTAEGLDKGQINIKITGIEGIQIKDPSIICAPISGGDTIPLINTYINDTIKAEQTMRETFQGTENMRIPYDYSESGIQTTLGTPLPAVAFVMSETPKSNQLYWDNAFQTIMRRDNLKPEDWNRLNIAGKARATILTICYAAQYKDYVGDTVADGERVRPYENFGDALTTDSGDCEDLGGTEKQCHNAFLQCKITDSPILLEMQQIAQQYAPPLSLDVVRGAQVSDREVHYGAHMNVNFIPMSTFYSWMDKTREGRKLAQTLPKPKEISERLPFLVGEGTGMYEPYGYDNPLVPIMGYVYSARSLGPFKKPIMHRKGEPGSFFVGSLVGLTSYFYDQGASAPLAFWYCTKQKNGELTRGVSYADMMNESDAICIKPQPMLSRKIMSTIEEAILRRVPPDALVLSSLDAPAGRKTHSVLDRICHSVASMNRTPGPIHQKVPVYIRPHEIKAQTASEVIRDFERMDRVWKVDYELEQITDKLWGYRMEIYVN